MKQNIKMMLKNAFKQYKNFTNTYNIIDSGQDLLDHWAPHLGATAGTGGDSA